MCSRRHASRSDAGFSLIEIMVTVALMSVLFGLTAAGYRAWALAEDHKGTANAVQSTLRNAQVRAVTEGISFCVKFDTAANTYGLYRYVDDGDPSDDATLDDCTELVKGPLRAADGRVGINTAAFRGPDGTVYPAVTFRPSGSAWPGQVKVTRANSAKVYTLNVEGFTGRVFTS